MLRCGLTGGIGSGKSTVAAGLVARGAALVDADAIARAVVEPGGPAYAPVVARFGPGVVGAGKRLDRAALAAVVFADASARADLDALTHPVIGERMLEAAAAAEAAGHRVLVLDVPLLDEGSRERLALDVVVVVDTPVEVAVQRLVGQRGFAEGDARARVAAQMSRERRRALADRVVDNAGDRAALEGEIDRTWAWLVGRAG
ncbi:MAG TPA: dephospho-CoA kinase [Acidimicrobiales bacterium]|nr:dephospho-CoA kinase [Acidimicrobiales bacterium]